jgi:hypothetical protein
MDEYTYSHVIETVSGLDLIAAHCIAHELRPAPDERRGRAYSVCLQRMASCDRQQQHLSEAVAP